MTLREVLASDIAQKEKSPQALFSRHPNSSQQNPLTRTSSQALADFSNDPHMTITVLHRLLANYSDGLGRLAPHHHPLRVLSVLDICRERAASAHEIIERSGFSQSSISILLGELREAGVVEAVGPPKRFGQCFKLTENGQKQLSELEALEKTVSAVPASLPDQVAQETTSRNLEVHDPDLDDGPEKDMTAIYKAVKKRFPDVVKDYKKRRPKVNGEH